MKKFTKPFAGVQDGEIYPTEYQAGDECPPELEAGAESVGALGEDDDDAEAEKAALHAELDAAGIKYDKRSGVQKLKAALAEGKKD